MLLTRRQSPQSTANAGIDSTKVGIHVSLEKALFPLLCGLGSVAAFICAHDHMRGLVWASLHHSHRMASCDIGVQRNDSVL